VSSERRRRFARYLPSVGTLASTLLIILAVPPFQWPLLIWVGLVPWLFGLRSCGTTWEAALQGFWLNFLLGFGGAFWVAPAAERYLELSFAGGAFILLVHALVHQLQLVWFGALHWRATRAASPKNFLVLFSLACLYTGFDWLTPKLFGDSLGVVLASNTRLRPLAAFGGSELLTFIVALTNLALYSLLAKTLEARRSSAAPRLRLLRPVLWLLVPLAAFLALGSLERARMERHLESPLRTLHVGIVQGSVPEELRRRWARGDPEAARENLDVYLRGTQRLLEGPTQPDLIVWPETTYPGVFRKPESEAQLRMNVEFDRAISSLRVPIAFGAYDREDRTDRRVLRNAIYLVEPAPAQPPDQLSPMQVYHKSTLFPVGEYVPLLDATTAKKWLPGAAHLSSGHGPELLYLHSETTHPLRIGPSICYEDVGSRHVTELARQGAEILLNVSNDSWFGDAGAAQWHLMMAILRSVETGLPQIRATNSGYSAFILPTGDVYELTEFGEEAVRSFELPLSQVPPTIGTRLGDWFGPFSLALALLWFFFNRSGVGRKLMRRSSKKSSPIGGGR